MKLPEGRKERIQVLVLAGIVGVAVLYGAQLGAKSVWVARNEAADEVKILEDKLAAAGKMIDEVRAKAETQDEMLDEIRDQTREHFIEAEFGNYFLTVKPYAEGLLTGAGFEVTGIREMGASAMPAEKNRTAAPAFSQYTVGVSGVTNYAGITTLLDHIERRNPYVTLLDLGIRGRGDPEKHGIGFRLLLPIWANLDMAAMVKQSGRTGDVEAAAAVGPES